MINKFRELLELKQLFCHVLVSGRDKKRYQKERNETEICLK